MGNMNEPAQITDTKKRYAAGVLKYAQMGYWNGDYEPKETDVLALFRNVAIVNPQRNPKRHRHLRPLLAPLALQAAYRLFQHRRVHLKTNGFDVPRLLATQHVPRTTKLQIQRSGAEYSRASPVPGIKPGSNALTVIPSGSRGASP